MTDKRDTPKGQAELSKRRENALITKTVKDMRLWPKDGKRI